MKSAPKADTRALIPSILMRGVYRERGRAEGFGALAVTYDQTRPSYPIELVNWLSLNGTGTAVDVGCGTGRVASLLADFGWSVIGVEPDERMADIARAHGVQVVVAPFEQCVLPRGEYDLVCSGTAWHWIDPAVGYDIASTLLRHGGRLAVFRNSYMYDPDVANVIDAALQRYAPNLLDNCIPLGTAHQARVESHAQEMTERSDLFTEVDRRTFVHERLVTANDWIKELETHSPIAMLDRATRERLLGELAQRATASIGDQLRIRHETPCVVAKRR